VEDTRRSLGPRAVLGVVALVLVTAVVWAASALAGGGSSANEPGTSDSPAAANVQNESQTPDHRDCPNGDRASAFSSDV
jgi:hypothetical protein